MYAIVCSGWLSVMCYRVYSNYPDYKFKTSVIWDSKDARWIESITIPLPTEKTVRAGWSGDIGSSSIFTAPVTTEDGMGGMDRWSDSMLIVKVFDKERLRRKTLLGVVSLKLTALEFRGIDACWYALEGGEYGDYGEVHFGVSLNPRVIDL